jgi:hypothetical protein
MKKLIFILLLLFLARTVSGATYYIDFDTGDNGDDGSTAELAWLTEAYAITQMSSGDTLQYVQADWADMNLPNWETMTNAGIDTNAIEIKQWSITWTLSQYEQFGRYVNGDFWVLDATSIDLTAVSPLCVNDGGWIKHGSMVNPDPDTKKQGYDNSTYAGATTYDDDLNWCYTDDFPVTINAESSLISAKSDSTSGNRPQLLDASILTVVDSEPNVGDFRPPYCGTDKASYYNVSAFVTQDVYDSILLKLSHVSGQPAQADVERDVQRPWLEHMESWTVEQIKPTNNYHTGRPSTPTYAAYVTRVMGDIALWLHCDYTDAQKRETLIGFLQIGIDYWGNVQAGGNWRFGGGHGGGRKWPIIFAGIVFNHAGMKNVDGDTYFDEDEQTFTVASGDVPSFPTGYDKHDDSGTDRWGNYHPSKNELTEYATYHIDMPEWGETHTQNPTRDGLESWTAYRQAGAGDCWHGQVLAALITGYGGANWGKTLWNHDHLFDYQDRYVAKGWDADSTFATNMWSSYRSNYGTPWTGSYDIDSASTPNDDLVADVNTHNSSTVSWAGSSAYFDLSANESVAYLNVTSPFTMTGFYPGTQYTIDLWGKKTNGIRSFVPREITITTEAAPYDLIAHYKLDDAAGQTTVLDSSGNNFHGTAANSISSTTGQIDSAINFNGVDDYVKIADNATFDLSPSMTVACWAKHDDAARVQFDNLVSKYSRLDGKREWSIFMTGDTHKLRLRISTDGSFTAGKYWDLVTDDAITDTVWNHIAFTFNSGVSKIYVNGVSVDFTIDAEPSPPATTFYQSNAPVIIGANYQDYGDNPPVLDYFFDGVIDEVRIYKTVLTDGEIAALYQLKNWTASGKSDLHNPSYGTGLARYQGGAKYPQLWNGLIGAWVPAFGATGAMSPDISGKHRNGALAGTAHFAVGKYGMSIDLDGDSDYIEIADHTGFTPALTRMALGYRCK